MLSFVPLQEAQTLDEYFSRFQLQAKEEQEDEEWPSRDSTEGKLLHQRALAFLFELNIHKPEGCVCLNTTSWCKLHRCYLDKKQ